MAPSARYLSDDPSSGISRLDQIILMQRNIIDSHIHLIASACYPFRSVLGALCEPSFVLPVEGVPGERYLPGTRAMDIVEREGERLALALFKVSSGYGASLQPHSGTQANQIAYNAVLREDDVVLCLNTKNGGHISHTVLISRRHQSVNYGVDLNGNIDYNKLHELAISRKPRLIIVGGSALPRAVDFKICGQIARICGAYLHADISHTATFIAAGVHASPFPYCDFATFNTSKNLRGPNSGIIIFRSNLKKAVQTAIFPTTQGGANETGMLGKFAALLEWNYNDINIYANSIVEISRTMVDVFIGRNIKVLSGGTDCHIIVIDLESSDKSGAEFEQILERNGVLVNRNLIPFDRRSPLKTSGIRIGTANLAILGYSRDDARLLANWIADIIKERQFDDSLIKTLLNKYMLIN